MSKYCPNKNTEDFKKMSSVLGDEVATSVWYSNQGQPVWNTKEGIPSKLYIDLQSLPGVSNDEDTVMAMKSRMYTKSYKAHQANKGISIEQEPTVEEFVRTLDEIDAKKATIERYKKFNLLDKTDPTKPIKWAKTDANYKKVLKIAQNINAGTTTSARIIDVPANGKTYLTILLTPKTAFTTEDGQQVAHFDAETGTITFTDKGLTAETVVHEFAHPFVDALAKNNPELFKNLLNDIKKDAKVPQIKKIIDHVNAHYSEAGNEILDKELLAYTISEYGKGNIDPATGKNTKSAIKRFYKWLTTLAKDLMDQMRQKKTLFVDQIHPQTKYNEIADLFTVYSELGDINLGTSATMSKKIAPETITGVTKIDSLQLIKLFEADSPTQSAISRITGVELTDTGLFDNLVSLGIIEKGKGAQRNSFKVDLNTALNLISETTAPKETALQKKMRERREAKEKGGTPPAHKMVNTKAVEFVDIKDEAKHMSSLLPKEIATELTPGYVKVLEGGNAVVGMFKNSMITLSEKGPRGTAYHEGFHAVFRTLLDGTEQRAIIAEARKLYVEPTAKDIFDLTLRHDISEADAETLYYEEILADEFAEFMHAPTRRSFPEKVRNFFRQLGEWISRIFNNPTKVDKLFNGIKKGKYTKRTPNIQRGVAYKVHPIFSIQEVNKITRELTSVAFENISTIDDLKSNGATMERIADRIADVAIEAEDTGNIEVIEQLELLFDQESGEIDNFWLREIDSYMRNSLGLKSVRAKKSPTDKVTEEDQDEQNQEDLERTNFLKSSYEVSGKVNATAAVKFMVAMTPQMQLIDHSKQPTVDNMTQVLSPLTGLPVLVDFGMAYNDLENILSDTVSARDASGELQDGLELMLDIMKTHAKYKPELLLLADKLDNASEEIRTQFFNAFSRQKGSFVHHQITGKAKNKNVNSQFTSSNFSTKSTVIRDNWTQAFAKEFGMVEDKELVYNPTKIERFLTAREKLVEMAGEQERLIEEGEAKINGSVLQNFKSLLNFMGVKVNPNTLNYIVESRMDLNSGFEYEVEYIQQANNLIYEFTLATNDLAKREGSIHGKNNHITDNTTFFKNILAEAEAYFKRVPGENSFVGPDGNNIYSYQDNDLTSKAVNQIKQGDLTHLKMVKDSAYGKHSIWAHELMHPVNGPSNREDFQLHMYGNLKSEQTAGDKGAKASELKPIDAYMDNVNKHLAGYYVGLAEADKSRQTYFKGPKFRRSEFTINTDGDYMMNKKGEGAKILKGYLADELSRMSIAHDVVFGTESADPAPEKDLVLYYHYYPVAPGTGEFGEKKDKIRGNAFYSFLFPGEDLKVLGLQSPDGKPLRRNDTNFWNNDAVNTMVTDSFARLVDSELKYASAIGLIEESTGGSYTNKLISKGIVEDPKRNYMQGGAIDVTRMMADYVLNSLIGNIEQTKLFNGDPAIYKVKGVGKKPWAQLDHFGDLKKRIPAIFAAGKDFRIFNKKDGTPVVRPHYTSATIANIEVPSAFFGTKGTESYSGLITPDENTIFVFGSNPEGRHGAGAAKVAATKFGAKYGQGEGLQGNAYALPTKDLRVKENKGYKSISPSSITKNISKMYEAAKANPTKKFKIGYTNSPNETTLNGYSGKEMIEMFNAAGEVPTNVIFSDVWVNSGLLTGLQATGEVIFNKENMDEVQKATGLPMEKLEKLFKPYLEINQTDAQAWITLDAYRERMQGLGKWTAKHQTAYDQSRAGENMSAEDVKMLAQPLKTVHAELVPTKNGELIMQYNKQSEAVLLPFMKDMEIGQLMKAMESATNPIDHVIVLDGKKAGASGIVDITDSNGKIMEAKDIKMNAVTLSYNNLFLQQDLPSKGIKDTLVGSQGTKNVLSVVDLEGDYANDLNGRQVVEKFHATIGKLSDQGLVSLDKSIGYDNGKNEFEMDINGRSKVHKIVQREFEGEISENHQQALEENIAFDALPIKNKIMNKLMALVTKKTVKLKQTGGALIQLSDLGFIGSEQKLSDKVKNGIIWFSDPKKRLEPMSIKEGEVKAAQILIPHGQLIKMLATDESILEMLEEKFGTKDFKELTHTQIKSVLSPSILEGMSYRIPNQGPSSNDAFEIVGVLPAEMGDTMVAFSDITTKTGSDFDIDKAFVVLPNYFYDKKTKKIQKVGYDLNNIEGERESGLQNLRLDLMREMLMHPSAYASVMAPLDDDTLETFIKELFPAESTSNAMEFFTGRYQLGTKTTFDGAKALVGVIANHMTNHSLALSEGLAFRDYYLGKGRRVGDEIKTSQEYTNKHTMALFGKAVSNISEADLRRVMRLSGKVEEGVSRERVYKWANSEFSSMRDGESQYISNFLYYTKTEGDDNLRADIAFNVENPEDVEFIFNIYKKIATEVTKDFTGITDKDISKGVIDNYKSTSISNKKDVNGNEVAGTLGAYMNAIVDAAKDPFIVRANLNHYTAGIAFMMARTGVEPEWIAAFIGQPILRDVVLAQDAAEGRFGEPVFSATQGKYLSAVESVLENYGLQGVTESDFRANDSYPTMRTDMESDITTTVDQLIGTIKNVDIESSGYKQSQLKVLKQFLEWQQKASQLNDVIKISKADVEGATKTLMTAQLAKNLFHKTMVNGHITNLPSYFGAEVNEKGEYDFASGNEGKMIGRYYENSILGALKRFSRFFIAGSKASEHTVGTVAQWAGYTELTTSATTEQLVYTISNEIYTAAATETKAFNMEPQDLHELLYGSGKVEPGSKATLPLAARVEAAKSSELADNLLINGLQFRAGREGAPDKVYLPNTETVKETKEALYAAWNEILASKEYNQLGKDLIKYAFYTSGFSKSVGDFSEHIPNEWLKSNDFHEDIKLKNAAYSDHYALEGIEDKIFKNLYKNNQLVPVVGTKSIKPMTWAEGKKIAVDIDHGFLLTQHDSNSYTIGDGPHGKIFKRFLKREVPLMDQYGDVVSKDYMLYRLQGYTKNNDAVYIRTNTLGVSGFGNNVKEYIGDGKTSIFPKNNVSLPEGLQNLVEVLEQRGSGGVHGDYVTAQEQDLEGEVNDRLSFCIMK